MASSIRKSSFDIFDYLQSENDTTSTNSSYSDLYQHYKHPDPSKFPIHSSIWIDAGLPDIASEDTIQSSLWKWATFRDAFRAIDKDKALYIHWSYKGVAYNAKWDAFLRWMFVVLQPIKNM